MYENFEKFANELYQDYNAILFFSSDDDEIVGVECPFCNTPLFFDEWESEYEKWEVCPACDNTGNDWADEDEEEWEEEDEESN